MIDTILALFAASVIVVILVAAILAADDAHHRLAVLRRELEEERCYNENADARFARLAGQHERLRVLYADRAQDLLALSQEIVANNVEWKRTQGR